MVITIDGPAGAGKSTVAKELARRLRFSYLDTGAMYRALTLKALEKNVDLNDEKALVDLAGQTAIDLKTDEQHKLKVFLDGRDVTVAIRSLKVTNQTFHIARQPSVREILVGWQRQIGQKGNFVVEGRDAGTVIFPQAAKKFYLDADFKERARRRIKDLRAQEESVDESALKKELKDRDEKDLTRAVGPLKKADDAVLIDSTRLTVDQVVEKMLRYLKRSGLDKGRLVW